MSVILPILIVVSPGAIATLICHRMGFNHLLAAPLGAFTATVLWAAGVYALLFLTAPNELGAPLLGPVLSTFITALIGSILAIGIGRGRFSQSHDNEVQ
jgi:hypothetical protein